jgi:signal transduction histidine kinase
MRTLAKRISGKIGFQTKLLLVFVVILGVVMALLAFIHYQSEKVLLNNSVANLRNMVNIVHYSTQSLSTERPISQSELDHFLREVITKKSAVEASVVDFDNQIVASSDPRKIGTVSPLPPDSIGVWVQLDAEGDKSDKVPYQVRIPLVKHKQVEGIVEISMLLSDLRSYLWRFNQEQIVLFLVALASAFGVFFLFLRKLHRPFTQLAEAAKKVSTGDFNVQLDDAGKGEEREMAAAFNHMAKKLIEQRQMEERLFALERRALLSELGASVAHEIRNPLNLMNLTLHQMGKTFKAEDNEKQESFLKMVTSLKGEVQHLNQVVTDFLNLGKATRPSRRTFKLRELVSGVAVRLNQQMAIKELRLLLDCPEDVQLNADEEQIRLVILNLLLNCIDLVPAGSVIEFTAQRFAQTGEIKCSVADHGPGIAPEDLEQIFEPYFTKRTGGMGLGLTLARRIVEEHGGEIHASNRREGGAVFQFTVPAEA